MLSLFIVTLTFGFAAGVILVFYKIRKRALDRERHRLLAKRKYQERELLKPRIPTKAPEPYLWKSDD